MPGNPMCCLWWTKWYWNRNQRDATITVILMSNDQLNMFRANFCPSSGAQDWGFFTTCGIMSSFLHTVHIVPRCRAPNPCLRQQQDIVPHVVKNLSLALLKMGKGLPETCWADHGRSIKLLLLHLVGFYFTLPTLMMHGETQIKWYWNIVFTLCGLRIWEGSNRNDAIRSCE